MKSLLLLTLLIASFARAETIPQCTLSDLDGNPIIVLTIGEKTHRIWYYYNKDGSLSRIFNASRSMGAMMAARKFHARNNETITHESGDITLFLNTFSASDPKISVSYTDSKNETYEFSLPLNPDGSLKEPFVQQIEPGVNLMCK